MRTTPRCLLPAVLAGAACAPLPAGSVSPAPGTAADERVLIGSFSVVDALAVSRRFVYAAGPGGVAVYDRPGERFLLPASRDLARELGRDGTLTGPAAPIVAIAGDPFEDALWIGVPGAVITYRPFTQQVQRTIVTGVPQRIVFDRSGNGDALVATGGEWTRISRVGIASPASAPLASETIAVPGAVEVLSRYPALRAQLQQLQPPLANRPRGQFALLAAAASPDRTNELWIGTDGDGLFRLDPAFGEGGALRYGLLDPGAGALALAADGVWVAGLGRSARRGGLTFATFDLQHWRWIDGTIATPLAGVRTYALATRGSRAWLGTERGLVRVQLDGRQEMDAYTRLRGLPDDRVYAVAAREDGVWAGTARGLVFVADSLPPGDPVFTDVPVYALQVAGRTLWAGTQRGLLMLPANGREQGTAADRPRAVTGGEPALRTPVRALAAADSVLLVATDQVVFRLDARDPSRAAGAADGAVPVSALDPRFTGPVTRLAADERAFALAGRDGLVLVSRRTGARREWRVPGDLPGPVLDVLLQRDFVFLATPDGLLRIRRTDDGLVP